MWCEQYCNYMFSSCVFLCLLVELILYLDIIQGHVN